MEKLDHQHQNAGIATALDDDDMMDTVTVSSQSTMTYESSGDMMIPEPVTANSRLVEETYAELWQEFVRQLWNSTDSLWLLPCCSDDNENTGGDKKQEQQPAVFTSNSEQRVQQLLKGSATDDLIARLITDRMKNVSLLNRQDQKPYHHQHHKLEDDGGDYDHWLLKQQPPITNTGQDHNTQKMLGAPPLQPLFFYRQQDQNQDQPAATTMSTNSSSNYEEWLGWKRLVQKVNSMGDQHWLLYQRQQPQQQPVITTGRNSTPPQPGSDKGEGGCSRTTEMELQ